MAESQTGPDNTITAMQTMLTTHGLSVSPTGEHVLTVELHNATPITVTTTGGDNPRWTARAGETAVYDSPAATDAATDALWAAEAVTRYAAETERGTDLTDRFGGSLHMVLERAFAAHSMPTTEHPGSTMAYSGLLAELQDGNDISIWDTVHETLTVPAAEYRRFGAYHRLLNGGPKDGDVPEEEIPLARTSSLWGDLAVLIHTVKSFTDAVK